VNKTELAGAVCAGSGIGMVVGLIMGLAASPVVGTVLGALSAGLLALLGLAKDKLNVTDSFRVAAFGISCVIAILLGITIRTHSWLSPDPSKEIERWTAAKFTAEQARQVVLYERAGILQKDWNVSAKAQTGALSSSFLFATPGADDCGYLSSERYPQVSEQLGAFTQKGGEFAKMAQVVQQLPEASKRTVLDAALALRCGK